MQIIVNNKNSQISCQRLQIIYLLFYIVVGPASKSWKSWKSLFYSVPLLFLSRPIQFEQTAQKNYKWYINKDISAIFSVLLFFSPSCHINSKAHYYVAFLASFDSVGFNWGKFVPFINRTLSFFFVVRLMRNSLIWVGDINCFFVFLMWENFCPIFQKTFKSSSDEPSKGTKWKYQFLINFTYLSLPCFQ